MNNILWWFCLLLLLSAWMPRFSTDWHEKRSRVAITALMAGLLYALLMPNHWLGAYTALFVVGLFRVPSPYDRLHFTVWPALTFAALYALLAPIVTEAWVIPTLWAIVACGGILSAWLAVSLWKDSGTYDLVCTWRGYTWLHLYEHQPHWNATPLYSCGQGNMNFAQALAGVACASSVGLVLMGSQLAWLAVVITALPLIKIKGHWLEWPTPSQGWAYLLVIGCAVAVVAWGLPALLLSACLLIGLAIWSWRTYQHVWSGRPEIWGWGWQVWKDMSWRGKLFGGGPESWINIFKRDVQNASVRLGKQTAFATHAHNEFLHELVERGVVGVVLILGYLATTFFGLFHAGPMGHAVFVVGAAYVACMGVSFPASLYHELALVNTEQGDLTGHGMPPMNTIGLAIVLLAGAILP